MVNRLRARLRQRAAEEEGAIAIMSAALVLALIAATSLAVDVGRVGHVSRDQQGATDRAALDAVSVLAAPPADGSLLLAAVRGEVEASLFERNQVPGWSHREVREVHVGCLDEGGAFLPVDPTGPGTGACETIDAVWVGTHGVVPFVFPLGGTAKELSRVAVARLAEPIGAISAASVTASVSDGALNSLLGGILGVELSLVGYQGLANATVSLGDLAGELDAGTLDELLDTELTVGELARAMGRALAADDEDAGEVTVGVAELVDFPLTLPAVGPFQLGDLLRVGGSERAAMEVEVDVLGLLFGAAQVAAPEEHAVILDLGVPEVTEARLTLVEPPVVAVGPAGETVAETAQLRLDLELEVASHVGAAVGPITSLLGLLPGLEVTVLDDPLALAVTTAHGTVSLTDVTCTPERVVSTAATVTTAAASAAPIEVLQLTQSLPLVGTTTLGHVSLAASASAGTASGSAVFHDTEDTPFPSAPKPVTATSPGLGDAVGLEVGTTVAGLDADLVSAAVLDALRPLFAEVDTAIDPLLAALGADLGTVEARALDARCGGRALVRPARLAGFGGEPLDDEPIDLEG
jgi:uncharacterized membrane protein